MSVTGEEAQIEKSKFVATVETTLILVQFAQTFQSKNLSMRTCPLKEPQENPK